MQMPKHSNEAKDHFRAIITAGPGVEVKPMFGSLGAFVHGHMFAGLFAEDIGVKLDGSGMSQLGAMDGTGPFGPADRPMSGWLSLPAGMDDADMSLWTDRAREHVASLPPKVRRPKKK